MKTIGVIPARLASLRFPAKVLAKIDGKPMIQHVWERASACKELDDVLIACDHQDIFKTAQGFKAQVVMTGTHQSGSDRIAEAVSGLNVDIVLNIQSDEPFMHPKTMDALAALLKQDKNASMGTVIKEITGQQEGDDPNIVKCVVDKNGYALYFSRAPIPYYRLRTTGPFKRYKHLGLYAYRKDFLMQYKDWPKSVLESAEELEQLRVLEEGFKIKTTVTVHDSIAVDTPQDLEKAKIWFEKSKSMTK